ncbi:histidine phosphatase family protein [Cerasicoccus fimbriatus]|uniref:histidine phosphatase family protein n=1 Tax=Cerasicoccus fimbriatus TaxID=3014554 RepID=UPI0022B59619|nr:histidine phosphatase family protein [Cerasicoccus sp. TK19100]
MRIYLIRHADPDYANNTITPAGHLEAQALATRLAKQGLDRIFCSPMGRAQDTARYTAKALGLEPTTLEWTRELDWPRISEEGLGNICAFDLHGHSVHLDDHTYTCANWSDVPPLDDPAFRIGYDTLCREADQFIAGLGYERAGQTYRIANPNRLKIGLFCHGGFGLTLLSRLLNIPMPLVWTGFFLPPSSVTTILFDERNDQVATPRCLGVGDISHLYASELPMSTIGIKANKE